MLHSQIFEPLAEDFHQDQVVQGADELRLCDVWDDIHDQSISHIIDIEKVFLLCVFLYALHNPFLRKIPFHSIHI